MLPYLLKLRIRLLRNIFSADDKSIEEANKSDLRQRLENDVKTIERFLVSHICEFAYLVCIAALIAILLYIINSPLFVLGIVLIPISLSSTHIVGERINKLSDLHRDLQDQIENFTYSSLTSWKEIKANNLLSVFLDQFTQKHNALSKTFFANQIAWFVGRLTFEINENLILRMSIYFVGGFLIYLNQTEIGQLLVFINYFSVFSKQISRISDNILSLKKDMPEILRILQLLDIKVASKKNIQITLNKVELKIVHFKYPQSSKYTLCGVNLELLAGEHIMVTGKSGSGKSTLIKLVTGFLTPTIGRILFDGTNISDLEKKQITEHIAVVNQDSRLFHLSIRDNLLLANSKVNEEDLWKICSLVNIDKEIKSFPHGLDTVIGEKGIKLSGGQQQKLLIAQALLRKSKILILDEALSALDFKNEEHIVKKILSYSQQQTVILVTHNQYNSKYFNKVVNISDGKITEILT